jgi:hypothetical protein
MKGFTPAVIACVAMMTCSHVMAESLFDRLFSSDKTEKVEAKKARSAPKMPNYKACEATKEEAFINLSAQMLVIVKNEVESNVSESKWAWFTKDNSVKQSVTSNAVIMGAGIETTDTGVCVTLKAGNVVKMVTTHIAEVLKLEKSMVKYSFEQKVKTAAEIVELARNTGSLVVMASYYNSVKQSSINRYELAVKHAQNLLTKGAIRFTGSQPSRLYIDGGNVNYGKTLFLAPGQHSYRAEYNSACSQLNSVSISAGEERTVELERLEFPKIRFNAPGVTAQSVTLNFNNKNMPISKLETVKTNLTEDCRGTFSWHATSNNQTMSGEVSLDGGDNEEIDLDFLSHRTIGLLKKLSKHWKDGKLVEFAGSVWVPSHDSHPVTDEEIGHTFNNLQASYLNLDNAIAHGPTLDYSTYNDAESYHVGYQLRLRITGTGTDDIPFHMFALPLVPFIYGQASLGYMNYTNDAGKEMSTEQDDWRNFFMSSVGIGSSLLLSRDFALVAKAQKNFFLDTGVTFYLGASLHF